MPIRSPVTAAGRPRGRRQPCDVPAVPHSLTYARFYVCGWRCDEHRPRHRTPDTSKDSE